MCLTATKLPGSTSDAARGGKNRAWQIRVFLAAMNLIAFGS
jgi:hypothetical protein